jgi:hypothetical protein
MDKEGKEKIISDYEKRMQLLIQFHANGLIHRKCTNIKPYKYCLSCTNSVRKWGIWHTTHDYWYFVCNDCEKTFQNYLKKYDNRAFEEVREYIPNDLAKELLKYIPIDNVDTIHSDHSDDTDDSSNSSDSLA